MAESPTSLSYPAATPADQLFGGRTFNTTTNTWVEDAGAVTLQGTGATRDPGNPYECQLADGTGHGFMDTTYTLTAAQVLKCSVISQRITITPGNVHPGGSGVLSPLATDSWVMAPGLNDGIYDT